MRSKGILAFATIVLWATAGGCGEGGEPATAGNNDGTGSPDAGEASGDTGATLDDATGTSETGAGWGEPVDCEYHRAVGESSIRIEGSLGGDPVMLVCDFTGPDDDVHWCPESSLGFQTNCVADGYVITIGIDSPAVGTYSDPAGEPRYHVDIRESDHLWSGKFDNVIEHTMTVTTWNLDQRRITGDLTAAWQRFFLEDIEFPGGVVEGDFDLLF